MKDVAEFECWFAPRCTGFASDSHFARCGLREILSGGMMYRSRVWRVVGRCLGINHLEGVL